MRKEARLQLDLCEWMRDTYPDIPFHSDLSAGRNVGPALGSINKRLQWMKGMPDLYIFRSAYVQVDFPDGTFERVVYHALCLELKSEDSQQILKSGEMGNEKHVAEQRRVLEHFEHLGYKACFAIGLDQAKKIINEYLSWAP